MGENRSRLLIGPFSIIWIRSMCLSSSVARSTLAHLISGKYRYACAPDGANLVLLLVRVGLDDAFEPDAAGFLARAADRVDDGRHNPLRKGVE